MKRTPKQAKLHTSLKRKSVDRKSSPAGVKRRGASESVTGFGEKFNSLLRHHKLLFVSTPKRLWRQPAQTLMTALVIAIALGLPAFFYSAVVNLQAVGGEVESTGQVTIFLAQHTTPEQVEALQATVKKMAGIESVEHITPQQALNDFKEKSGFGEVLDLLEENPLPNVLLVMPVPQYQRSMGELEGLIEQISHQAFVDDVLLDMRWLERLNVLLRIARNLTLALGAALSLGVLLIIGNTIRLEIENRKAEIQVVKLIGGTDAYVRRPFLYTGVWYGAIGGVLAWLLVAVVMLSISEPASQLANLYESHFELEGVDLVVLMAMGAILGLLGSYVAVGSHISMLDQNQ